MLIKLKEQEWNNSRTASQKKMTCKSKRTFIKQFVGNDTFGLKKNYAVLRNFFNKKIALFLCG